jgi:CDP-diacylglycerol--inositol 3-phosphatidyltransferase
MAQRTLFFVCFCNELFYVCLYLNKFYSTSLLPSSVVDYAVSTLVGTTAKHPEKAWRIFKAFPGSTKLLIWFLKQVTWVQILAAITGPICFLKNIINMVQFWKASKIVSPSFCLCVRPSEQVLMHKLSSPCIAYSVGRD